MRIDEALQQFEDYMKINTSSSHLTIKKYKGVVRRFLLYCGMSFDVNKINEWLTKVSKDKNCNYYRYALQHLLISVGREDLVSGISKSRAKPRQKVFRYVPKETMQKIINSLDGVYQKIAFLQLKTGARVSEIITLRAENIDFGINPSLIQIKIGVNKSLSKRKKEKTLYLSKKYEDLLKSWIIRPFGYIFLPNEYEPLNEEQIFPKIETIRREFDRKLAELGKWNHIEGLSSHYLRHLFSDYFLKAGGDPVYLQKALGHARMDTTMGYVSIAEQMVQKVIMGMENE
jgi:integrase